MDNNLLPVLEKLVEACEKDIEIWRLIPSYSHYEASNLGRIRKAVSGRILKSQIGPHYETVGIIHNQKIITRKVQHLIAETFLGPRPTGCVVHHKDDNKLNNKISNIEYMNSTKHKSYHSKQKIWTPEQQIAICLLKEGEVLEIRSLYRRYKHGYGLCALAVKYGVSPRTIHRVIKRQTWAHI